MSRLRVFVAAAIALPCAACGGSDGGSAGPHGASGAAGASTGGSGGLGDAGWTGGSGGAAGASPTLPPPWKESDVGSVGVPGHASANGASFSVTGAGNDIWDAADGFHFVYQPVTGDTEIVAQLDALTNTHDYAKAGVMIRQSLEPGSAFAFAGAWPALGSFAEWRTASAASASTTGNDQQAPPRWFRLSRQGSTFTASSSSDGQSFSDLGSQSIDLKDPVLVGLAVTSHDITKLATGEFANVKVQPLGPAQNPTTGTGNTLGPAYLCSSGGTCTGTTVTGGGAMPSTAGAPNADSCLGLGDAGATTQCLNDAIASAHAASKPLVVNSGTYVINAPLIASTSLIGAGATQPLIQQTKISTSPPEYAAGTVIRLAAGLSGWIYNLHVVGAYTGSNPGTEWDYGISVGGVNGVTISGNLIETPAGDCISDGAVPEDGTTATATNVLVTGNTLINPWRCDLSLTAKSDRWAILNNVLTYDSRYVTPIDFEPENGAGAWVSNIEIGFNQITSPGGELMDGSHFYSGIVRVTNWADPTPGENVYVHHNFSTSSTGWGVPFQDPGAGTGWNNVVFADDNLEQSTLPTP